MVLFLNQQLIPLCYMNITNLQVPAGQGRKKRMNKLPNPMPFISNHKKAVNLLLSIAVLNSTSHERSLSKTDLKEHLNTPSPGSLEIFSRDYPTTSEFNPFQRCDMVFSIQ